MKKLNMIKDSTFLEKTKDFVEADFGEKYPTTLLSQDFEFTAAGRRPVSLRRFLNFGYTRCLRKVCPSLEIEVDDLRFDISSNQTRVLYSSILKGGKFESLWTPPPWVRAGARTKTKATTNWQTGPLGGSVTFNNDGIILAATHGYPLDRTRNDALATSLDACWLAAGGDAELMAMAPGLFISDSLRRFRSVEFPRNLKKNELASQVAFTIVQGALTSLAEPNDDAASYFAADCIILGSTFAPGTLRSIQFRSPWPKAKITSLFNWRMSLDNTIVRVDITLDNGRLEQATAILDSSGRISRLALGFRLDDQGIDLWNEIPAACWSEFLLPKSPKFLDDFAIDIDQYVKRTARRSKNPRDTREQALDDAIDFFTTPAEPPKVEIEARASRENALSDLLSGQVIKKTQNKKILPIQQPPKTAPSKKQPVFSRSKAKTKKDPPVATKSVAKISQPTTKSVPKPVVKPTLTLFARDTTSEPPKIVAKKPKSTPKPIPSKRSDTTTSSFSLFGNSKPAPKPVASKPTVKAKTINKPALKPVASKPKPAVKAKAINKPPSKPTFNFFGQAKVAPKPAVNKPISKPKTKISAKPPLKSTPKSNFFGTKPASTKLIPEPTPKRTPPSAVPKSKVTDSVKKTMPKKAVVSKPAPSTPPQKKRTSNALIVGKKWAAPPKIITKK
eukprot:CAMPEP_0197323110 /NCGR_PEP_ID=MMETSP0891-20130614/70313_1 /TAXON_ID=44058 ORGANISM="Aureoumbra lagunensis, Strain CCMP1510" /NCGR_SAMPLE_ID=MMETSP0891 /ASSEMBLY_ACC=CAM_ASM_000534 /LENGTH=673 /DNA_ID=CAMNT_0042815669 /DNA_START=105 /DNA_END=2126 /DNA_ORIENTATION=-